LLFQNTVDKLVQRANASILIGTSSWKEQFVEAITVSAGKLWHLCLKCVHGRLLWQIAIRCVSVWQWPFFRDQIVFQCCSLLYVNLWIH